MWTYVQTGFLKYYFFDTEIQQQYLVGKYALKKN